MRNRSHQATSTRRRDRDRDRDRDLSPGRRSPGQRRSPGRRNSPSRSTGNLPVMADESMGGSTRRAKHHSMPKHTISAPGPGPTRSFVSHHADDDEEDDIEVVDFETSHGDFYASAGGTTDDEPSQRISYSTTTSGGRNLWDTKHSDHVDQRINLMVR